MKILLILLFLFLNFCVFSQKPVKHKENIKKRDSAQFQKMKNNPDEQKQLLKLKRELIKKKKQYKQEKKIK